MQSPTSTRTYGLANTDVFRIRTDKHQLAPLFANARTADAKFTIQVLFTVATGSDIDVRVDLERKVANRPTGISRRDSAGMLATTKSIVQKIELYVTAGRGLGASYTTADRQPSPRRRMRP